MSAPRLTVVEALQALAAAVVRERAARVVVQSDGGFGDAADVWADRGQAAQHGATLTVRIDAECQCAMVARLSAVTAGTPIGDAHLVEALTCRHHPRRGR